MDGNLLDSACNYPYQPLHGEQHEFRVLDVYPGTGKHVLQCCLRHLKPGSGGISPYETISYCWGDHTSYENLVIDDLPLAAPATAVAALLRMRLPTKVRTLWIDAICIDQEDYDERADQVTRMAGIYRHSRGNLVYLGEDDPSLVSAVRSIHNILPEVDRHTNDAGGFWDAVIVNGGFNFSATGFDDDTKLSYTALDRFFSRAWFSRLWVIQETLVAPSNRCFCGPHELELLDVLRAAVWMLHKHQHWRAQMDNIQFNVFFDWWYKLRPERTREKATFDNVLEVLFFSRIRKTSDTRDRLFALLGLLPEDVSKAIKPDYRISALALMQRVTRQSLLDDSKTNVFNSTIFTVCSMEEGCGIGSWPSWVPRWDRPPMRQPGQLPVFFAAGGEEALAAVGEDTDESILSLGGFVVDRVTCVTEMLKKNAAADLEYLFNWLNGAQETAREGDD